MGGVNFNPNFFLWLCGDGVTPGGVKLILCGGERGVRTIRPPLHPPIESCYLCLELAGFAI